MKNPTEHPHLHDLSPRLINWLGWSIAAGALALILRRMDFMMPTQLFLINWMEVSQLEGKEVTIAPRWSYLIVYFAALLSLTGLASYYKPWKTLPQIAVTLFAVTALTPVLMLWNIYFFGPALLFSTVVCCFGSWVTAWFIKDAPLPERDLEPSVHSKDIN